MQSDELKNAECSCSHLGVDGLSPYRGSRRVAKRYGKGEGSGRGKTSGRGHKGARARSGYSLSAGFEGGQMPLYRRLPKRGFTSRKKISGENLYSPVRLENIIKRGLTGEINVDTLRASGLARSGGVKIKIVSGCELKERIVLCVHAVTSSVKAAVEKAGGEIKIIK